ncbi:MAG: hypothetical protein ABRQ37_13965 [Candidatus Eremiobacterota bacterium]
MDELREKIKKTGNKISLEKNKEIIKYKTLKEKIEKKLEEPLDEPEKLEDIREFIERYKR